MKLPSLRGVVRTVAIAAVLYFAIQGGEYSTTRLLQDYRQRVRITGEIDSLKKIVDSLTRYRRRLDSDAALQERIAREQFGWVRSDKEIVYRFYAPDSLPRDTTR